MTIFKNSSKKVYGKLIGSKKVMDDKFKKITTKIKDNIHRKIKEKKTKVVSKYFFSQPNKNSFKK